MMVGRSDPFDLRGKVALVTGGSSGLGRAMAVGMASAGATIIVTSRRRDACETVVNEIRAIGAHAVA